MSPEDTICSGTPNVVEAHDVLYEDLVVKTLYNYNLLRCVKCSTSLLPSPTAGVLDNDIESIVLLPTWCFINDITTIGHAVHGSIISETQQCGTRGRHSCRA